MTSPLASRPLRPLLLFVSVALALIGVELGVVRTPGFAQQPNVVALAVTLDLVLGLPLLYYVVVLRRSRRVPPTTLLPLFLLAVGAAWGVLPAAQRHYVRPLVDALPLLEMGVLTYGVLKIRAVVRQYYVLSRSGRRDFLATLTDSLRTTFGKGRFIDVVAGEVALVRYGLLGWLGREERGAADLAFTTYRQSGQGALTGLLLLVCTVETGVVHVLLTRWPVVAGGPWLATALSAYTMLFFWADWMATRKRPVLCTPTTLHLRLGLRWQAAIDRANVANVVPVTNPPDRAPDLLNGALLAPPNVLIFLHEPTVISGPLGIRRTARRVALWIDDHDAFIRQLTT